MVDPVKGCNNPPVVPVVGLGEHPKMYPVEQVGLKT